MAKSVVKPSVSIIVVCFNNAKHINRCLAALATQSFTNFEAIIIDNCSEDQTVETLKLPDARFRLVNNTENRGFSAANNQGAAEAKAALIATVNPDAYAEENWLSELVGAAEIYPEAAMFGSTQINANDPVKLDGAGDCFWIGGLYWRGAYGAPVSSLPTIPDEIFSPCAAAALWRRDVFMEVGGFDEDFFCYGEDVDLAFRMRLIGNRAYQIHTARVLHEGYGSTGRRSEFATYYGTRNRTWVVLKNFPGPLLLIALPLHSALQLTLLVRDVMIGNGPAALRGLRDAIRGVSKILKIRKTTQAKRTVTIRDILTTMAVNPLVVLRRGRRARAIISVKLAMNEPN
jgi:N-acetylglucosaminyl-diphospho-decaprenol L-rhamnosyltransferase